MAMGCTANENGYGNGIGHGIGIGMRWELGVVGLLGCWVLGVGMGMAMELGAVFAGWLLLPLPLHEQ